MRRASKNRLAVFFGIIIFSVAVTYVALEFIHYQKSLLPPEERPEKSRELQEKRKREWKTRHTRFHTLVEERILATEKDSTCIACHGILPHTKTKKVRSLLNMHTEYMVCESCHLHKDMRKEATFRWYSPVPSELEGIQYGTDYDEKGMLIEPESHAKIVPIIEGMPFMVLGNLERAKEDMDRWNRLSKKEQERLKSHYHQNMEDKGQICTQCHSEKESDLDFLALGFSEKRAKELTYQSIAGMIEKYEKFYIPDLFRKGEER